ncbi:MAG: DUF4330 domain-containing protein [Defluviitaleaceae bacterium]|nr:DUF4330 domain-containing protein [Defluviitaleaceae bacterium]
MIIDKEAKLFGKINIIDALIVIAVIALVAFGAYQLRSGRGLIGGESREFILTFFTEEIEDWAVEGIRTGDNVFDHLTGLYLGTVESIRIDDSIVWNADQYGNTVRSTKEGFSSMEVRVRVTGTTREHGVYIAGNRYGIGMNRPIRAGGNAVFTRISGLREAGQ